MIALQQEDQVAAKPLTKICLNTSIVTCLRDSGYVDYRDSIIGAIRARLNNGLVYFNRYPNFTVILRDANILYSVVLYVKAHEFKFKETIMFPSSQNLPIKV